MYKKTLSLLVVLLILFDLFIFYKWYQIELKIQYNISKIEIISFNAKTSKFCIELEDPTEINLCYTWLK